MKKNILWLLLIALLLTGCSAVPADTAQDGRGKIAFEEGQLYAVACLGYGEMGDVSSYTDAYLSGASVPIHYVSAGEYYLIIPRYDGMALHLYQNDLESMERVLLYECADAQAFIVQCNISDIFPDVTVRLTWEGETVEFSPYISLKDGSIQVGEHGLNITMEQ